jgi:hypothetical protein
MMHRGLQGASMQTGRSSTAAHNNTASGRRQSPVAQAQYRSQYYSSAHDGFEAVVKGKMVEAHQLASVENIRTTIKAAANQVLPDVSLHVVTWGSAIDGTAVLAISDVDYVVVNQANQPLTRKQKDSLVVGIKHELKQLGLEVTILNKPTSTRFFIQSGRYGQQIEFPEIFDVVIKHVLFKQGKVVELIQVQMPGRKSTKWAVGAWKLLLHSSGEPPPGC